VLETRLIREVRARQESSATEELVELVVDIVAGMFPDLLTDALKRPEVRTAINNIVAIERRAAAPQPPSAARRSAARGVRRV
jgi:hypothetical protein